MMGDEEESREHFSLKAILDQEKPKRKGRKKKKEEEVRTVHTMRRVSCTVWCVLVAHYWPFTLRGRSRRASRLTWQIHASLPCMSRPCLQLTPPTPSTSE